MLDFSGEFGSFKSANEGKSDDLRSEFIRKVNIQTKMNKSNELQHMYDSTFISPMLL